MKALLIVIIAYLLVGCQQNNAGQNRLKIFRTYYSLKAEKNNSRWDYVADTLLTWFEDRQGKPIKSFRHMPESNSGWGAWDRVMNTTTGTDSLWFDEDDNTVKGFFLENNDFYKLIGKPPTKTLRTYWFDKNEKLAERLIYWIPEENIASDHFLQPIVGWALVYDSLEITTLYGNGQIVPSQENAIRWKQLLNSYNRYIDSLASLPD